MTQDELKSLLHYNPETGMFTWLVDRGRRYKSGRLANSIGPLGYVVIRINGILYYAHRLAYLYVNGIFPECEVDHINHNKSDNRWVNLRHASHSQNCQNVRKKSNNTTGYIGVSVCKRSGKYAAEVKSKGKKYFLGRFICSELANLVASEHREKLHGEFARAA